tara:strand:+ start:234 stop:467 length:234 start_codon:yes stop_codon:yes gene_type:complete
MAKIDADGVVKIQNGLKNPLISMHDNLSKTGDFSKIKDEFDHMMAFIRDMETTWKDDNSQEVKVVVNDIHYKPADQQ